MKNVSDFGQCFQIHRVRSLSALVLVLLWLVLFAMCFHWDLYDMAMLPRELHELLYLRHEVAERSRADSYHSGSKYSSFAI